MNTYGIYVPAGSPETVETREYNSIVVSLHASRLVENVKQNLYQILDPIIKEKVTRFLWRFEDILKQELKQLWERRTSRTLSLYYDKDYAEVTWTFVDFGAGFVFEKDKTSWFYFFNGDKEYSESFGELTNENCANKIREIIRYVMR